jgi:hypothetical protein
MGEATVGGPGKEITLAAVCDGHDGLSMNYGGHQTGFGERSCERDRELAPTWSSKSHVRGLS